jgi:hypothetical protein
MLAALTGDAAPRLKCGKKSGRTSGMPCDVNPVEGERKLGYKQKKKQGFSEPANLIRKPKGSKTSEVMTGKPEGKSFLAKRASEKGNPTKRSGFFVERKSSCIHGPHLLKVER